MYIKTGSHCGLNTQIGYRNFDPYQQTFFFPENKNGKTSPFKILNNTSSSVPLKILTRFQFLSCINRKSSLKLLSYLLLS